MSLRELFFSLAGFDCTFEDGMCGYVQDQLDDSDWLIGQQMDGPTYDHTTGSGENPWF